MVDHLDKDRRSWNMSKIRAKNTRPELIVRKNLYVRGYRYRIHVDELPGTPDIVLRKYKLVIFVNGCFWHQHSDCPRATIPKSNIDYWLRKLKSNTKRFEINKNKLIDDGWNVGIIWECEVRDLLNLNHRIDEILPNKSCDP